MTILFKRLVKDYTLRLATAIKLPHKLISRPVISLRFFENEETWQQLIKSQISILRSFPPENIKLPAGLNATVVTEPV